MLTQRQPYVTFRKGEDSSPTAFAHYILPKLKGSTSFFGLKKHAGLADQLDNIIQTNQQAGAKASTLELLLAHAPEAITNINSYMITKVNTQRGPVVDLHIDSLRHLEMLDDAEFRKTLINLLPELPESFKYHVFRALEKRFPAEFHQQITTAGESCLNMYLTPESLGAGSHLHFPYTKNWHP